MLAASAWAAGAVWLRSILDDDGIEPLTANAIRMASGAATLWVVIIATRGAGGVLAGVNSGRTLALAAAAGALGTGVSSLLFMVGIQEAGAGKAAILTSTSPLFTLPLAFLFLAERPAAGVIGGTALAVAGIFLVV